MERTTHLLINHHEAFLLYAETGFGASTSYSFSNAACNELRLAHRLPECSSKNIKSRHVIARFQKPRSTT